jgi:dynein heavy chain 1
MPLECTLNTLKQAKRFHATAAFDTDTIGLKRAKEIGTFFLTLLFSHLSFLVGQYKMLMKDFPINDLLTAAEIDRVAEGVAAIFVHLKRTKNAHYPITRYLQLVEAVSRDMCTKVLAILRTKRLLHLPYSDFDKVPTSLLLRLVFEY